MARYLLLTLLFFSLGSTAIIAQTSLYGKIIEKETGEAIIGANVVLKKNGVFETGSDTDFDGNYSLTNLDPGTYDIEVSYVGFPTQRITDVIVAAGKGTRLDVELESEGIELDLKIVVTGYKIPLIDVDNTSTGGFVTFSASPPRTSMPSSQTWPVRVLPMKETTSRSRARAPMPRFTSSMESGYRATCRLRRKWSSSRSSPAGWKPSTAT